MSHREDISPEDEPIWSALRTVPDPEFGLNIVDMGLIYEVNQKDGDISVIMTLTTPNCPSGDWIYEGTKAAVRLVPFATNVEVTMVFDPPWTPEMLSEEGKRQMGW